MARSRTGRTYGPRIPEKDWQQQVLDAARYLNWRCYHTFDSRRSAPGFPDVLCVKDGKMICLELKTETGKATLEQEIWIAMLDMVPGVTARIARPSDWDAVLALLRAG